MHLLCGRLRLWFGTLQIDKAQPILWGFVAAVLHSESQNLDFLHHSSKAAKLAHSISRGELHFIVGSLLCNTSKLVHESESSSTRRRTSVRISGKTGKTGGFDPRGVGSLGVVF